MKNHLLLLLALFTGLYGCDKEEIDGFKGEPAVNFQVVTTGAIRGYILEYSFLTNPENEYLLEVPVSIMGDAIDRDRYFRVEVVDDETTTARTDQYEIVEGKVLAGEYQGKLYVRVFKTADLGDNTAALKVRLVDSDDFKAGNAESSEFVISWTNRAIPPAINVYVRTFFIANWSTAAYRIFVETTGMTNVLAADYSRLSEAGVVALATKFGDYIKQWNLDHPGEPLVHDDGPLAGQLMDPINYTRSKYD